MMRGERVREGERGEKGVGGLDEELSALGDARARGGRQRRLVGVRRALRAALLLQNIIYMR
jgi:hypothetical protein